MREYITATTIANEICMGRSTFAGTYLIVEGESDQKLFRKFTENSKCKVKDADGKQKVKDVLRELKRRQFIGVIGIVDADFDHLDGFVTHQNNLFLTDSHDIETMIMQTPALSNFLIEYADTKHLDAFVFSSHRKIQEILTDTGISIGYIRWASQRYNWNLKFKELDYTSFIDPHSLVFDFHKFYSAILLNSTHASCPYDTFIQGFQVVQNQSKDVWNLCCGHDLVAILLLGLIYIFGKNTHDITPQKIAISLRLAYEKQWFTETDLYKKIINWEQKNPNFKIFS